MKTKQLLYKAVAICLLFAFKPASIFSQCDWVPLTYDYDPDSHHITRDFLGSFASDNKGIPYWFGESLVSQSPISFMSISKFDGKTWKRIGNWTSDYLRGSDYVMALDGAGTPYMAYNYFGREPTVIKFNGSSWEEMGNIPAKDAGKTSLVVDSAGTPYVAYYDNDRNARKFVVMKYDGNNWVPVSPVSPLSSELLIDGKGILYIPYTNNNEAIFTKFDGNNWTDITTALPLKNRKNISFAVSNKGTPYVTFIDSSYNGNISVMKFEGNNWVNVGAQGFSSGKINDFSFAINKLEEPYIIYLTPLNNESAGSIVMKFDGNNWVTIGRTAFAKRRYYTQSTPRLAFDSTSSPYAAISMNFPLLTGSKESSLNDNDSYYPVFRLGVPAQSNISGKKDLCPNATATYTVDSIPGAAYYTWSLPAGWKGASTTNTITVTAGNTGGAIFVYATTSCGTTPVFSLSVTIQPQPPLNVALDTLSGIIPTLIASSIKNGNYQWIDCTTNTTIPGATSSTYKCTHSGLYAVKVTTNGCTLTSPCVPVIVNSIAAFSADASTIYPNPANDYFTIESNHLKTIKIYNTLGKQIAVIHSPSNNKTIINTAEWTNGIYFITLIENNATENRYKLIVNH